MWGLAFLLAATAAASSLTSLTSITCAQAQCDIVAGADSGGSVPLRLYFHSATTVRWWLAIDGNFSDTGMGDKVIIGQPTAGLEVQQHDAGAYWELSLLAPPPSSPAVTVRLQKAPVLLTLLVGGAPVLQEAAPLSWNDTSSWQTLARDATPFPPGLTAEHFFGGGMQNGRFAHRDASIYVDVGYDWDDGGHPNPVPLFSSSAGYAVLRNTWAPGMYSFGSPVTNLHNESTRFDAYLMAAAPGAGAFQALLEQYTQLTGPPFLPPIYGLFSGDSDCYHNDRHGNSTQVSVEVAKLYRKYYMPGGWILVQDGYGCGYGEPSDEPFPHNLTDLISVVAQMHAEGFYTGLWTSTGMPNIQQEVGVAGTRICKTDVGWIGAGYEYAFDGVSLCAGGIEEFSTPPARRFVWTVEGWAGTHRCAACCRRARPACRRTPSPLSLPLLGPLCSPLPPPLASCHPRLAVMWTGDDSGSMDYVRWQIPTFIGCGFSAQAHISGDVDGIFGGSPESYVRDLQFKALTTTIMTMSGWAPNPDKQPWTWGEPYTTYNRASLKLKSQLTPYMYSLSREAYDTGVPPIRALLLEFPGEEALYQASNATLYTFLSGPFLLVAPVYEQGATTRDAIPLPAGTQWVDWWDGSLLEGNQTLMAYRRRHCAHVAPHELPWRCPPGPHVLGALACRQQQL
jgi:alpha-glucosidase